MEPAFQVPQGSPPSHLKLQSLPPSLTRFLYHREVDNLLSTALDADEEALAVNHQMSRRAHQIPRFARGRQPLQSIQLAFALCPGDPYMPCSALTATQYRQLAAFPNIADLQPFIVSARDFWTANNIEDPESSVAAARLRKALAEFRVAMHSAQSNRIRALATTRA